ncbi:hypothetical protein [Calditerricola satsumensis]|uniref:Uncharacterized protein n=1 Tax=Calditerricola satsumensis TaxID=373054 RepID=A0A8J3B3E2_9BACI|nr:hypothetical protein [Calditerricola satsumensis]GGJ90452.1 hypothetical protein GCM10007043_00130 [Calditerricola satsumensis]
MRWWGMRELLVDPICLRYGGRLAAVNAGVSALILGGLWTAVLAFPGPRVPWIEFAFGAALFLAAWILFVRRLPPLDRSRIRAIGIWGTAPFWAVGITGSIAAILLAAGGFRPASVFAYGVLSALAMGLGLACWIVVAVLGGRNEAGAEPPR